MKGRVGDVPFVGCGGYANDKGAAATTGHGEKLIKLTLARQVVIEMENGRNAQVGWKIDNLFLRSEIVGTYGLALKHYTVNSKR